MCESSPAVQLSLLFFAPCVDYVKGFSSWGPAFFPMCLPPSSLFVFAPVVDYLKGFAQCKQKISCVFFVFVSLLREKSKKRGGFFCYFVCSKTKKKGSFVLFSVERGRFKTL